MDEASRQRRVVQLRGIATASATCTFQMNPYNIVKLPKIIEATPYSRCDQRKC